MAPKSCADDSTLAKNSLAIRGKQTWPSGNWIWVLFTGLIDLIVGILIWSQWPVGAVWMLGILVGISLLTTGISVMMFAIAARHVIEG